MFFILFIYFIYLIFIYLDKVTYTNAKKQNNVTGLIHVEKLKIQQLQPSLMLSSKDEHKMGVSEIIIFEPQVKLAETMHQQSES